MSKINLFGIVCFLGLINFGYSQEIQIINYSQNVLGQVELEIEGEASKYYLLTAQHDSNYETITSMTVGVDGAMYISEPLDAYPLENYSIYGYDITEPADTDGDIIDDYTELSNQPTQAPLNFADEIPFLDGLVMIPTSEDFSSLATIEENIPWAPFLNDQEFVKFAIVDEGTDHPAIYFINSQTHFIHNEFLNTIGIDKYVDDVTTGELIYNPNTFNSNGVQGAYSFNYSFGNAKTFEETRLTFELLAKNMPFLQNNLVHFIGDVGEAEYIDQHKEDFIGSRINVVLESEFFAEVDFLPFNQAEGFGYFRQMNLGETPGSRDIVLYDAIPNTLPRVGGIITSVIQTPLSHVNLRAIQDNVPNAFIRNPLDIPQIANLLNGYIYYEVTADSYEIREATLEEVNDWFEAIRPTEEQIPIRDLSFVDIRPLDSIEFEMSTAFGAKCSNVATMRKFGFPEGTIPDGFGIPFYFYDEFMKFNGFYDAVEDMISDEDFITDLDTRINMLKEFRKTIKAADMPEWMLDALQDMHDLFPEGTAVRCRSSTNNEDLPGFSGAGLYTSKTQHLDEGHISKSIKQVYASMWNFRAFDERDFYRIDHYAAAMGILCHPNFEDEKSNGVGISIDPIYDTPESFYLNTQVGESLITNPDAFTIPEEILLSEDPNQGFTVLRYSNLVMNGELVMNVEYLDQMRDYLSVIHDEFAELYNVVGAEGFGMDIEYKVTKDDLLIIKQARPWVSFWANIKANQDLAAQAIIEPISSATLGDSESITVEIANKGLEIMKDFELALFINSNFIETLSITDSIKPFFSSEYQFLVSQDMSAIGDYNIEVILSHPDDGYQKNDTIQSIVSKLYLLEGSIEALSVVVDCGGKLIVDGAIKNLGESIINTVEIEVKANGEFVEILTMDFVLGYLETKDFTIVVTENLQVGTNEIVLNILSVNGAQDAISDNNSASITSDGISEFDYVTLIINTDDFPVETSWAVFNSYDNEVVRKDNLGNFDDVVIEKICLDYSLCYRLEVYDTYGDGICCEFGMGDFVMLDASGDTLFVNDGDFENQVAIEFCPSGSCGIDLELITQNATSELSADGIITIDIDGNIADFEFSIDGGENFYSTNIFIDLLPGMYTIVVRSLSGICSDETTVDLGYNTTSNAVEILKDGLIIYPNPTSDFITIAYDQSGVSSENLSVEIYNNQGVLVNIDKIAIEAGQNKVNVPLQDYPSGSYRLKCFNKDFVKYYTIIKI